MGEGEGEGGQRQPCCRWKNSKMFSLSFSSLVEVVVLWKNHVSCASLEVGEGCAELLSLAQEEGVFLRGQPEGACLLVKLAVEE